MHRNNVHRYFRDKEQSFWLATRNMATHSIVSLPLSLPLSPPRSLFPSLFFLISPPSFSKKCSVKMPTQIVSTAPTVSGYNVYSNSVYSTNSAPLKCYSTLLKLGFFPFLCNVISSSGLAGRAGNSRPGGHRFDSQQSNNK